MLHAKYLIICVLPLILVKASYEIWKIIVVSFEILLCIWEIGFCLWCFMQILMIVVINPQKFVLLETIETPNSLSVAALMDVVSHTLEAFLVI